MGKILWKLSTPIFFMAKKLELVAPGGSLEKIEYAYCYRADAVYIGLPNFSLRARMNEFTPEKIRKAVKIARSHGKKIFFTLNIYAHERHLGILKKHLKFIAKAEPDAIIVSDPGIISLAKKIAPKIRIHLSTQANTTNSEAIKFWRKQGISRIILAREITLGEIKKIKKACPRMELEYFVHGAMCMSYSGRCLLSSWMRGRSANLGDCVQPCRWPYRIMQRDKEKIILSEDEHGTYILNSKDLCLIEYLEKLAKAGVESFKIEGRTKSVYYVACAVKAYRQVLDAIRSGKKQIEIRRISHNAKKELEKLVNRGHSTGFLLGRDKWENDFEKSHQKNEWQFVGEVMKSWDNPTDRGNWSMVKIHNVLKTGDKVEIISPVRTYADKILGIMNINMEKTNSAHGGSKNVYYICLNKNYPKKSMVRKNTLSTF